MSTHGDSEAYDRYLAASLNGDAPDAEEFLGLHPELSAEDREAIRALGRVARRTASARRMIAGSAGLPFEELGEFRLLEALGEGGQGLVFLAEQRSLRRRVALKILRPELWSSEHAAERFDREARAAAALAHPNIVGVHAIGEQAGVRYIAMEYLPGRSLEQALLGGDPPPLSVRVRWMLDVARALEHAHARGLVHRDVKPSNVRLADDGRAVLIDFGLARDVEGSRGSITQGFAGSPQYASPEQIEGRVAGPQSDVYSLGVMAYRCLGGRLPFEAPSVEGLMRRILAGAPVSPRRWNPELPRDLESVILRAMEREPSRRYASARELAEDLLAVLELRTVRARPPGALARLRAWTRAHPAGFAAALSALCVSALLAGLFLWRQGEQGRADRARARELIAEAGKRVEEFRGGQTEAAMLSSSLARLHRDQPYRRLTSAEVRLLDQSESAVTLARLRWETLFYGVLDLVDQAQRLERDVAGADLVRGRLYEARMQQAQLEGDEPTADFYRDLSLEHDPDGSRARALSTRAKLSFTTSPPGARARLFRFEDLPRLLPGAEMRKVLVPHASDATQLPLGAWSLRLVEPTQAFAAGEELIEIAKAPIADSLFVASTHGALQVGDRLLAIDGTLITGRDDLPAQASTGSFERMGERFDAAFDLAALELANAWELAELRERPSLDCVVWRDGAPRSGMLEAGAHVRASAMPMLPTAGCELGTTPISALELEPGDYCVQLSLEGFEDLIVPLRCRAGVDLACNFELDAPRAALRGFRRVIAPTAPADLDLPEQGYWIAEHELTCGEWLEFLNDPETLAEIDASPTPIRFPRTRARASGTWVQRADGTFELPAQLSNRHALIGVSWHDVAAFARWRTQRAADPEIEFAIPSRGEFEVAGGNGLGHLYSWGNHFRAHYARTCFATRNPSPGVVMEYPRDCSVFGVYDVCGGAFEWLDAWFDPARDLRHQAGGSWARTDPELLKVTGGIGSPPDNADNEEGARLVARRRAWSSR